LENCLSRLERADAANWPARPQAGRLRARRDIRQTLRTLPQLSDAIAANYFAHSAISRTGRGRFNELSHHPSHALRIRRTGIVSHHVARLEPRATAAHRSKAFSLPDFFRAALRKARTDISATSFVFFAIQKSFQAGDHHQQPCDGATGMSAQNESTAPWESLPKCFATRSCPRLSNRISSFFDSPQSVRRKSWPIMRAKVLAGTRRCSLVRAT